MATNLTPVVVGIISALVVALIVLTFMLLIYCQTTRTLSATRKTRQARRRVTFKKSPNNVKSLVVSADNKPPLDQRLFGSLRPSSNTARQMYFPSLVQSPGWNEDTATGYPGFDPSQRFPTTAIGLQRNFDIHAARSPYVHRLTRQLSIAPPRREIMHKSRTIDEVSDQTHRKRRRRKEKTQQESDSDSDTVPAAPRGVTFAYVPQLIRQLNPAQPIAQVHANPTQFASAHPNIQTPASGMVAPAVSSQTTGRDEISWAPLSGAVTGAIGGLRGSAAGFGVAGRFGGRPAFFSASQAAARQADQPRSQHEDQERSFFDR